MGPLPYQLVLDQLYIDALAPSVHNYFQRGLALTNQRAYKAAVKQFHSFCCVLSPFPVNCFAAFLTDKKLAPPSVKSYLFTICNMQIFLGLPEINLLYQLSAGRHRLSSGVTPQHHSHHVKYTAIT